ncbi:unconventional myosin-XVIIIa-like [Larimichthys crocea]|uniref:unconventional myosin-XVIIIa-like n=1 Tax=Larimichthys crocea TaxID=215358 RepID=UPI000F5EBFD2|nr:unconventional myosin-XVIIIa-like [Larimichthys crocea]
MSWTDRIRTHIANITGRTERERLRRQVEEMQAELQTVKSSLAHALTDLDSKEISNNTLKEQLASVRKELFEENVWSRHQGKLYSEEIIQHRFENMQMNYRNKKLQDQLEHVEKEIKRMRDDRNMMAQQFAEVLEKYERERERNSGVEEELKQKDLQLQSVREQLEEVKQCSPSPGQTAEEQSSASDEADVDRSTSASPITEKKAEEQSSASDDIETDVDRSTSVSPITGEDAEEQSSASDDIEADVDRSTSASSTTEEKAEEQSSASDDVETFAEDTDTDDRRPILPEPDFDQHRTFQRIRKGFETFSSPQKKKPNTNRDNTTR